MAVRQQLSNGDPVNPPHSPMPLIRYGDDTVCFKDNLRCRDDIFIRLFNFPHANSCLSERVKILFLRPRERYQVNIRPAVQARHEPERNLAESESASAPQIRSGLDASRWTNRRWTSLISISLCCALPPGHAVEKGVHRRSYSRCTSEGFRFGGQRTPGGGTGGNRCQGSECHDRLL